MRMLLLTLLTFFGACANHTQGVNRAAIQEGPSTLSPVSASSPENATRAANETRVPEDFIGFDFKNSFYPTADAEIIRLKDGENERAGQCGGVTVDLRKVYYADIDSDGAPEAIAELSQVECGGSCDGGSTFFYLFSGNRGRVRLVSHIETGSIGYSCGLRSFVLRQSTLTLEAFRRCSYDGVALHRTGRATTLEDKFVAKEFTRFTMEFKRGRFVQTKREIIENPESNVMNYPSKIEITND